MNDLSIEQRIRHTLAQLLGEHVDAIDKRDSFRDFLGERFDSLMAVEVITAIEGCFDIEGTTAKQVERFIGSSDASAKVATACTF